MYGIQDFCTTLRHMSGRGSLLQESGAWSLHDFRLRQGSSGRQKRGGTGAQIACDLPRCRLYFHITSAKIPHAYHQPAQSRRLDYAGRSPRNSRRAAGDRLVEGGYYFHTIADAPALDPAATRQRKHDTKSASASVSQLRDSRNQDRCRRRSDRTINAKHDNGQESK